MCDSFGCAGLNCKSIEGSIAPQQTTTCDFTCSVSEFMSSTSSIEVNSPDFLNKFGVSWHVHFLWNHEFFHVMTRASETVPVLTQYDSCQNRSKVKTRDNRQNACIQVNTHENMYWWSSTNYEPVWHVPLVQKWFLVCWDCILTIYLK